MTGSGAMRVICLLPILVCQPEGVEKVDCIVVNVPVEIRISRNPNWIFAQETAFLRIVVSGAIVRPLFGEHFS